MEEIMPKQGFAKEYVVRYKTMNEVLKKKRTELQALQKKVTLTATMDLELQIKAMDLLISRCKGKMSKSYEAKAHTGKMSKGC
jgi:hypothetical protein